MLCTCYPTVFRVFDFLPCIEMDFVCVHFFSSYDCKFVPFTFEYHVQDVDLDFENYLSSDVLYRFIAHFSVSFSDNVCSLYIDLFDLDDDTSKVIDNETR